MRNLLHKVLPIIRIFFFIFVVFATTALYIYGQYLVHSEDWQEAIRMQSVISWVVVGGALTIIGLYVWLEIWAHNQNDEERNKTIKLLEAIAQRLGVDTNKIDIGEINLTISNHLKKIKTKREERRGK